ncbi:hypothetical protein C5167_012135 [Papaver somniferum]|uniref:Uncharacterized protein n=1 Tax=Papaver somniferum TaxID=3469 RepID=A0A4Y7IZU0_PAPSO|nr:uncharacterized protein LOC113359031 [Papaver somniferum]RZC53282.1 hypothetical protein C5167_012135 [Papaver somniferum]
MELSVYEDADAARERLADAIVKLNLARHLEGGQSSSKLLAAHAFRLEISPEDYHLKQLDKDLSRHYFQVARNLEPTNKLYVESNENAVLAFLKNKRTWGTLGAGALGFCVYKLAFGLVTFLLLAGGN